MAVIKCKMCGGDLKLIDGESVAECEYCGTRQTVPTADSEKKLTLFGRAGRLLRACEFDKAAGVFESIVAEFPEEAEAYWGLVLCKYGIEYVDDPATGRKIPTCHRSSFESVLDDDNFDQACENADPVARRLYREEAKAIEELRRGIIKASGVKLRYDILIHYIIPDEGEGPRPEDIVSDHAATSALAQDICEALKGQGYNIFIQYVTDKDGWLQSTLTKEGESAYEIDGEKVQWIYNVLTEHGNRDIDLRLFVPHGELVHDIYEWDEFNLYLKVKTSYKYFNAAMGEYCDDEGKYLHLILFGQKESLYAKTRSHDMYRIKALRDLVRDVNRKRGRVWAPLMPSGLSINSLCELGNKFISEGEWTMADECFDEVLDNDPEYAEAYFGKYLSHVRCRDAGTGIISEENLGFRIFEDDNLKFALKYGSEAQKNSWNSTAETIIHTNRPRLQAKLDRLSYLRERNDRIVRAVKGSSAVHGYDRRLEVKSDGTVDVTACSGYSSDWSKDIVRRWQNIAAARFVYFFDVVGLRTDGTLLVTDEECYGDIAKEWHDIIAIVTGDEHDNYIFGLRADGNVLVTGDYWTIDDNFYTGDPFSMIHIPPWQGGTNIVALYAESNWNIVGIRKDGTSTKMEMDVESSEHRGIKTALQCELNRKRLFQDADSDTLEAELEMVKKERIKKEEEEEERERIRRKNEEDRIKREKEEKEERERIRKKFEEKWGNREDKEERERIRKKNEEDRKAIEAVRERSRLELIADKKREVERVRSELSNLHGLFSGKRRKQIYAQLRAIDTVTANVMSYQERREWLKSEMEYWRGELSNLHGIFSGKRRKEIETRLAEIEQELNRLK